MGKQIVKQPNGRFAIWSSVVDDFTAVDCEDAAEIIDGFVHEQKRRITEHVNGIIAALDRGEKPYHQLTMSFTECVELIKELHGSDAESLKYFEDQESHNG